jgi:hypothetical protein
MADADFVVGHPYKMASICQLSASAKDSIFPMFLVQ